MARQAMPLDSFPSKIGKGGRKLYFYSGAWRSAASIQRLREGGKEYAARNRAILNEKSANGYRTNPKYRENARKRRIKLKNENPVKFYLGNKRHEASRKGLDFNLNEDWYLAHWSQGCEVTGRDFDLPDSDDCGNTIRSPWQAEIDRIDSGGPYTMDNCRLVVAIYNRARMNWTDGDVFEMSKMIQEVSHR